MFIVPGWPSLNLNVINYYTSVFHSNQNVTNTSFCLFIVTGFPWIHNRLKKKVQYIWLKFKIIFLPFGKII